MLFELLLMAPALVISVFLAYVVFSPLRTKRILDWHRKTTPDISISLLKNAYTPKLFVAWLLITSISVVDLVVGWYEINHTPSPVILNLGFVSSMLLGLIGLYLLWSVFRRK